jgi:hypothetical protein
MREAIRAGDACTFYEMTLLWLPLFISTGKTKYSTLTLLFRRLTQKLSQDWREAMFKMMFVRLSAGGFCVGFDALVEQVNLSIETMFPGGHITNKEDVHRKLQYLNARIMPVQAFQEVFKLKHTTKNLYKSESPTSIKDMEFMQTCLEGRFADQITPQILLHSGFSFLFTAPAGIALPESPITVLSCYYGTGTPTEKRQHVNNVLIKACRIRDLGKLKVIGDSVGFFPPVDLSEVPEDYDTPDPPPQVHHNLYSRILSSMPASQIPELPDSSSENSQMQQESDVQRVRESVDWFQDSIE